MATQNWYQPLDTNYLNQVDSSKAAGQTYRMNEMKILGEQRKTQQEQAINELTNLAANGDQQAMQKLSMVAPERAKGAFDYQENQIKIQNQKIARAAQIAQSIEMSNPDFKQQSYEKGLAQFAKEHPDEDISYFPKTYNKQVSSYLQQMILEGRKVEDVMKDEERKVDIQYKRALTNKALREPVGGELPAPLKLANEYDKARKAGDTARMNDIASFAKIYDKGIGVGQGGDVNNIGGYVAARQELKQGESAGKKAGELETEKQFSYPKAKSSMEASFAKNQNVINKIDEVLPKVDALTAGFAGKPISKISGTEANDVRATIDTIKANLGFAELQEMRNNSPTGGALGQVAVQEIAYLQSVMANLETSQSPEQLRKNLKSVKNQIIASKNRTKSAFDREYGKYDKQENTQNKNPSKYSEGQTATNPQTGQKITFIGGKWQ
jgi:hypothetical protein